MPKLPFHVFFRHGFSRSTCDWLWSSLLSLTGSGQVWLPLSLLLSSDVLQLPVMVMVAAAQPQLDVVDSGLHMGDFDSL